MGWSHVLRGLQFQQAALRIGAAAAILLALDRALIVAGLRHFPAFPLTGLALLAGGAFVLSGVLLFWGRVRCSEIARRTGVADPANLSLACTVLALTFALLSFPLAAFVVSDWQEAVEVGFGMTAVFLWGPCVCLGELFSFSFLGRASDLLESKRLKAEARRTANRLVLAGLFAGGGAGLALLPRLAVLRGPDPLLAPPHLPFSVVELFWLFWLPLSVAFCYCLRALRTLREARGAVSARGLRPDESAFDGD